MAKSRETDIAVIGAGPTGMAACLSAATLGHDVVHVAPSGTHIADDDRTTAIMMPGIDLLKNFGVWEALEDKTAPLASLRMVDDTGRLLRAPTVDFHASEIGLAAFGHNFRNRDLNAALAKAVKAEKRIAVIDAMASAVGQDGARASVTLSNGQTLNARLVVGADGVNSLVRTAAGIDARQWSYPQTALVTVFSHSRPHDNISTEFHTDRGPFTQVPLPGDRSSLVWVVGPDEVDVLTGAADEELAVLIEERLHSTLGKVSVETRPQVWPLSSLVAKSFAAPRIVLIGQAAHAFPPIGAQGLNLGLRDVADLAEAIGQNRADPGAEPVTRRYDRMRRADIVLRTGSVDALNRSLLTGFLPVQAARALSLGALRMVPPLRAMAMREGMAPGSGLRHLMESVRPRNPFETRTDPVEEYSRS